MTARRIAALALVGWYCWRLSTAVPAQAASLIFTSPDGVFQFDAGVLVPCTEDKHQKGLWGPLDSCVATLCDDLSTPGSSTLVCFGCPPELGAPAEAAFSVSQIKSAATEKDCLSGSPGWVYSPPEHGETVTINGNRFRAFHTDGVGSGTAYDGQHYRIVHLNKCYELSINKKWGNPELIEPHPTSATQEDWDKLNSRLEQPLHSFKFLK